MAYRIPELLYNYTMPLFLSKELENTDITVFFPTPLPTEREIFEIEEGLQCYDTFLYFKRIAHPNISTIRYSTGRIQQELIAHQLDRAVFDFSGREMVNAVLRREMLKGMRTTIVTLSVAVIVTDLNPFRRASVNFFARVYSRMYGVQVFLLDSKEEAFDLLNNL